MLSYSAMPPVCATVTGRQDGSMQIEERLNSANRGGIGLRSRPGMGNAPDPAPRQPRLPRCSASCPEGQEGILARANSGAAACVAGVGPVSAAHPSTPSEHDVRQLEVVASECGK